MNRDAFTYVRESDVEQLLTVICETVCEIVRRQVPESQCRALLLIGGYGRGEGGVEPTSSGPRPHNNLDFLLVTDQLSSEATAYVAAKVNLELNKVRQTFAIGIDFSAITARKLQKSPCLVMWYDMRHGHKTLLGDADFASRLDRFTVDRIPSWNVRDLLVNRGTLLLLNRWMNREADNVWRNVNHERHAAVKRQLAPLAIRHLVKAIIGYGDALLFFEGRYHWSYAEKLQRMQDCRLADDEFIEQYTEAASFRFVADYDAMSDRKIDEWQQRVTSLLSHTHLCCESLRLRKKLDRWGQYPEAASRGVLTEQWRTPRAWARKFVYFGQDWRSRYPATFTASCGLKAAGPRSRLSLAFPAVAYDLDELRPWACGLIGEEGDHHFANNSSDLLDAYIRQWGRIGDTNFFNFACHVGGLIEGFSDGSGDIAGQPATAEELAEALR